MQWQVQAQADPSLLGHTPGQAYTRSLQTVNRIERSLPGQVQFVNNLSDKLNTAAGDALYAETLYIMLALPGALVGLGLAYIAALGTVERDRRELALLRARGATRAHLLGLAGTESVVDRGARGTGRHRRGDRGGPAADQQGGVGLTVPGRIITGAPVRRTRTGGSNGRPCRRQRGGVALERQREPALASAARASRCGNGCTWISSRSLSAA